jgi:hypothetical protein
LRTWDHVYAFSFYNLLENGLEADRGVVEEALPDQDTVGSVVDHLEGAHPDQSQRPHRVAGDSDPGLVHHQDHI